MRQILCKRVYEAISKEDGRRILVDRLWPRGIKKDNLHAEWKKEIAPSSDLRKNFHNGTVSFDQFKEFYEKELSASQETEKFSAEVKDTLKKENVTFLFASKNLQENNAIILKEWIENSNLNTVDAIKDNHENLCRRWSEGDPLMEEYHDHEWCKIHHNDTFEFEMLCLEGASTGLSWRTILHKRKAYRKAFHDFDIQKCAAMSDEELSALLNNPELIRNRRKIFSVRDNAVSVIEIQKEYGSFDTYLWHFTDGKQIDGKWKKPEDVPTVTDLSRQISSDLKKHGMKYVGPVITYSFLQAVGIVNDHLADCPYR